MHIRRKPDWEIAESKATPEHIFMNRRTILAAAGFGGLALAGGAYSLRGGGMISEAASAEEVIKTADLYPAKRNEAYTIERAVTPEEINGKYNNFYEFGSHKQIYSAAQELKTRPWTITIDGEVEAPATFDIDDLIRKVGIEERLYRHRCVEAWSMTVPWTGFPMSKLVALAKPLSSAKYVRMETFVDATVARGQKQFWYPWPYVEGLTLAEATNDVAFLVTGAYGKPMPKQFGAPLRLAVPWKYGFKSIKSIVRFSFVADRPKSFWEQLQDSEYGFWANVNPEVSHPRWSQAEERVLGTDDRIPTQLFNGYAAQVADIYKDMKGERLYT